jgi:hypothetical protein
MQIYSTHTINDGRWTVTVWIKEQSNYVFDPHQRPDLRAIIDDNYNMSAQDLARHVVENVMDCAKCHVQTFSGIGVYAER